MNYEVLYTIFWKFQRLTRKCQNAIISFIVSGDTAVRSDNGVMSSNIGHLHLKKLTKERRKLTIHTSSITPCGVLRNICKKSNDVIKMSDSLIYLMLFYSEKYSLMSYLLTCTYEFPIHFFL